jgi:hypothetical protein
VGLVEERVEANPARGDVGSGQHKDILARSGVRSGGLCQSG